MSIKSIRIPDDIDRSIEYVARSERLEKSQSIRKLMRIGFEYYVAKLYEQGKLTLRETAGLLNLTLLETLDFLFETGVRGNIKTKDVMEALHELPS